MTPRLTLWTLSLILFCVVAEVGSQLNFKAAAGALDRSRPVTSLLRQALLWLGILLWAVEVVAWLDVLAHAPLTVAYPVMMLTYAATPLMAALALNERFTRRHALGAALVASGALAISLADLGGAR